MSDLPAPSASELALSQKLKSKIVANIKKNNGFLPFAEYMEQVLYFPQYGYYANGKEKFGATGDFITAPENHDLFAAALARAIEPVLQETEKNIYEFGAGKGKLAADLLRFLPEDAVHNYFIIELSPTLTAIQKETIEEHYPAGLKKVRHLTSLPDTFNGLILGNEVLDAIACPIIKKDGGSYYEVGAGLNANEEFIWQKRPLSDQHLQKAAENYLEEVPEPYVTELHPRQEAFIRTIAEKMNRAAAIFIDYGFSSREYYRPDRDRGTLLGHYRHRAVTDPFLYPGLVDLTCHVNFTGVAQASEDAGAELMGYSTQANFLLNSGITQLLAARQKNLSEKEYAQAAAACQLLVDPGQMGEVFKVIAFAKNLELSWPAFGAGDITHKL